MWNKVQLCFFMYIALYICIKCYKNKFYIQAPDKITEVLKPNKERKEIYKLLISICRTSIQTEC